MERIQAFNDFPSNDSTSNLAVSQTFRQPIGLSGKLQVDPIEEMDDDMDTNFTNVIVDLPMVRSKNKPHFNLPDSRRFNAPTTSDMVLDALRNLDNSRSGTSLQAIKKHISSTFKVDVEKRSPYIKKSLASGVANGKLVQVSGKGASGSFKLAKKSKTPSKTTLSKPSSKPLKKLNPKKKIATSRTKSDARTKSAAIRKTGPQSKKSAKSVKRPQLLKTRPGFQQYLKLKKPSFKK